MSPYRLLNDTLDGNDALRRAFRAHGVEKVCNALAPLRRNVRCTVFVLTDGRVVPEDTRITAAAVRAA